MLPIVSRSFSIRQGPPAPVNTPRIPFRNAMRPVRTLYRVGVQTVEGLWASVNNIPSLAKRSMLGVGTFDSGL